MAQRLYIAQARSLINRLEQGNHLLKSQEEYLEEARHSISDQEFGLLYVVYRCAALFGNGVITTARMHAESRYEMFIQEVSGCISGTGLGHLCVSACANEQSPHTCKHERWILGLVVPVIL